MTKTMAEAIREELRKGSYQMPGDTLPYETQAAAVAAALTAAGYGLVADAKREAEVSCPTRLMDGRNEIRCWLTAGHEGACK